MIDSAVIDYFVNKVVLVKIDAKADSITTKDYNISAFPTVVLTDNQGVEIDRIVGYFEPAIFLKKLDDYQNGIGTLDDLLSRVDTLKDRELYFEIAEKYKYRGGADEAGTWFQRVIDEGTPSDSLSGESRMALADLYRRAKEYDAAKDAFTRIMKDFKGTSFAEGAEIWRAIVYRQKADTAVAITAFEDFIKHYPESEDIDYAQGQIEKLKGETSETK